MAQAGEIRFDAVIDTSGYEKGVKDIQNATDEIKESAEIVFDSPVLRASYADYAAEVS